MSTQMTTAIRAALSIDANTPAVKGALEKISAARTSLMLDAPFYGALALRLVPIHNPRIARGTAATDGRHLFFCAEWINTLTHRALLGLLAHEVMHVALEHTLRREGRNQRDWNIACDHAINNDLKDAGYALPEDGMCDREYRGWSAEEIFPRVARPQMEQPQEQMTTVMMSGGGGEGADDDTSAETCGEDDDESEEGGGDSDDESDESDESDEKGGGKSDEQTEEQLPAGAVLDSPDPVGDRAEIQVAVLEAAMCAKAAGNMPAGIQKLVNELTAAKVDFRELLADFMQRAVNDDYSFSRPNRRYLQSGVYLPSLKSEAAPEIAFFMDTSGSRFSDEQLSQTVGALDQCIAQVQPERVHVIACDTEVQWRRTFERGEKLEVETPGGGGTDFSPPFDALEADGIEPACAIYLTDGYGRFPDVEPPYPVLWLLTTDNVTPPWGITVRLPDVRS